MSFNYDFAQRAPNNSSERIEVNTSSGIGLKKYNASPTSWPEYTSVQLPGVSHIGPGKTPLGISHPNANASTYAKGLNDLYK